MPCWIGNCFCFGLTKAKIDYEIFIGVRCMQPTATALCELAALVAETYSICGRKITEPAPSEMRRFLIYRLNHSATAP